MSFLRVCARPCVFSSSQFIMPFFFCLRVGEEREIWKLFSKKILNTQRKCAREKHWSKNAMMLTKSLWPWKRSSFYLSFSIFSLFLFLLHRHFDIFHLPSSSCWLASPTVDDVCEWTTIVLHWLNKGFNRCGTVMYWLRMLNWLAWIVFMQIVSCIALPRNTLSALSLDY